MKPDNKMSPALPLAQRQARPRTPDAGGRAASLGLVVLISLSLGCARHDLALFRGHVSEGIEQRTGHRLGPAAKPGEWSIPEGVSLEDGITEDEAVVLALWNNAAFQEILTELGLARADLIGAGLLPNPVFSLLFPVGPRQWEAALAIPLEALLLRPRRLTVAELQSRHVVQRLMQNGLELVRDVRVGCANLAYARDRVRLGEERAQLLGRIAELSEKRMLAGDMSEFEVAAARIDAIGARSATAILARDVSLAEERLRNLLGLGPARTDLVLQGPPDFPPVTEDIAALEKNALASRPDFRAAELATEAVAKRVGLSRWEFLKLDALFDGDIIKPYGFRIGPGFRIPLPIFNRNQDGVARATAELDRAVRHEFTVRNAVILEVNEAHTRWLQAQENLLALRTGIISGLEDAVRRAEQAFGSGNISYLMVLETTRRLLDAREREVEALANLRRARAELERSVGRRLGAGQKMEKKQESSP